MRHRAIRDELFQAPTDSGLVISDEEPERCANRDLRRLARVAAHVLAENGHLLGEYGGQPDRVPDVLRPRWHGCRWTRRPDPTWPGSTGI